MNYKSLPIYGRLIYITVVVFILTQLWKLTGWLFCWSGCYWQHWLSLPSNLHDLIMRPWTILTYMFCHADFTQDPFHLLFNMLWLWFFGQFFMRWHSERQFLSFYLTSGIVSGLFFVFCYNVFPQFRLDCYSATLVGASGALFALMTAIAIRQPEETLGLNLFVRVVWVKMKWFALGMIALSLLCLGGHNTGGTVCHIGGILFGALYALQERRGRDICAWPSRLISGIASWWSNLRRPRMTATQGGRRDPIDAEKRRDMDYNASQRSQEQQIDTILDKISKHGYDALSAEEKQMLFDASRRKRK